MQLRLKGQGEYSLQRNICYKQTRIGNFALTSSRVIDSVEALLMNLFGAAERVALRFIAVVGLYRILEIVFHLK